MLPKKFNSIYFPTPCRWKGQLCNLGFSPHCFLFKVLNLKPTVDLRGWRVGWGVGVLKAYLSHHYKVHGS